ncbi:MAG: hypothetical protein ACXWDN_10275 [Limisphaerales bacterium]
MPSNDYGVLEQLPSELLYLREVAWEGAQLPEYDLTDDNPDYGDKVYATVLGHFRGRSQSEIVSEVLRHRQILWEWLEADTHGKCPEAGALYFVYGLFAFPDAIFKRSSA